MEITRQFIVSTILHEAELLGSLAQSITEAIEDEEISLADDAIDEVGGCYHRLSTAIVRLNEMNND